MDNHLKKIPEEFKSERIWYNNFRHLSNTIKDIYIWVKDSSGKFVVANDNFLRLCKVDTLSELIGKTDLELYPEQMAKGFMKDDESVLRTGIGIFDRMELIENPDGSSSWFSTTKTPFRNEENNIIGTTGFCINVNVISDTFNPTMKMIPAVEYINKYFYGDIEIEVLASIAELPVNTFKEKFNKWFHMSPEDYITKMRVDFAYQCMESSNLPLEKIVSQSGFKDKDHLIAEFTKLDKEIPAEFR